MAANNARADSPLSSPAIPIICPCVQVSAFIHPGPDLRVGPQSLERARQPTGEVPCASSCLAHHGPRHHAVGGAFRATVEKGRRKLRNERSNVGVHLRIQFRTVTAPTGCQGRKTVVIHRISAHARPVFRNALMATALAAVLTSGASVGSALAHEHRVKKTDQKYARQYETSGHQRRILRDKLASASRSQSLAQRPLGSSGIASVYSDHNTASGEHMTRAQ
jgi:hypothetical protein